MTEDLVTEDTPEAAPINTSRSLRLTKHAGIHLLVWLVSLSVFAATDSWSAISGLGIASVLSVITGILAGLITTTLIHEWFHLLGARFSASVYDIPAKFGLFVLDWDFSANSLRQFFIMSVGGSVGGALAVVLYRRVSSGRVIYAKLCDYNHGAGF